MSEYVVGDTVEFRMRFVVDGSAQNPTQTLTITNEVTGVATVINDGAIVRAADGWMVATYTAATVGSFDLCWEAVNPNKTINDVFIVRKKAK